MLKIGTRVRIIALPVDGWPEPGALGTVVKRKGLSTIEVEPDEPCELQTEEDKSFPYMRAELEVIEDV